MNERRQAIAPLIAEARALDREVFLCSEVANALGCSAATVRRLVLRDESISVPTARLRGLEVSLFDLQAVDALANAVRLSGRAGRPLWSPGERRDRHRRFCAAWRRQRRADQLVWSGDEKAASVARADAARLAAALRTEEDDRRALANRKAQ